MNDFLKNKPMLAWILNLLSSILIIFIAFWLTGWSASKQDVSNDIESLKLKKADITYVNSLDEDQEKRINNKADKSLVESMDKKLDLILQKLR